MIKPKHTYGELFWEAHWAQTRSRAFPKRCPA